MALDHLARKASVLTSLQNEVCGQSSQRPYTIILTGGIASGKSTVSELFVKKGVAVVDTDEIAHTIVQRGQPALEKISRAFGKGILLPNGELDRAKMRNTIFADAEAKARLEAILHPEIARVARERISNLHSAYCILVVPLFAELGSFIEADRILVVDAEEANQIKRVMTRDEVDLEHARAILSAQSTRSKRLSLADDVIINNGTLTALQSQVDRLHAKYSLLAHKALAPGES